LYRNKEFVTNGFSLYTPALEDDRTIN